MKFSELPLGTVFHFNYEGLPPQLAKAATQGPFRKVAEDGAVDIADPREVKIYVAPGTNVVPDAFEIPAGEEKP